MVMDIMSYFTQETYSGEYPRCAPTKGTSPRDVTWRKGTLYTLYDYLMLLLPVLQYTLFYCSFEISPLLLIQHKSALAIRLLCNPSYPKNRSITRQKYGISLPDVHKKSTNAVSNLTINMLFCVFVHIWLFMFILVKRSCKIEHV